MQSGTNYCMPIFLFPINQGAPVTLAKRLHGDFSDLPNIVPASQVAELQLMHKFAKVDPAEKAVRWEKAMGEISKTLRKRLRDQEQLKDMAETFDRHFASDRKSTETCCVNTFRSGKGEGWEKKKEWDKIWH